MIELNHLLVLMLTLLIMDLIKTDMILILNNQYMILIVSIKAIINNNNTLQKCKEAIKRMS